MPGKIRAGTISILFDNVSYDAVGEFELMVGDESAVAEAGTDGHVAVIVTNEVPGITGVIRDSGGLNVITDVSKLDGVPIQVTAANGKTYVFDNCKQMLQTTVNTGTSGIPVEFRSLTRSSKEVGVTS